MSGSENRSLRYPLAYVLLKNVYCNVRGSRITRKALQEKRFLRTLENGLKVMCTKPKKGVSVGSSFIRQSGCGKKHVLLERTGLL